MKSKYDEGYKIGLNWKDKYTPGGPFVMHPRPGDSLEMIEKCKQTQINHREWHLGFNAGKSSNKK